MSWLACILQAFVTWTPSVAGAVCLCVCDFFCRVQFKSTAMHCAALTGHVDVVAMLAANGGDVKKCTMDGVSPLDSARMEGHNAVVAYLTDTFTKVRPPSRRSTLSCTRSTDPRAQPDWLSWAALQ